ncbi:MAG: ribonuclease [Verrucomicrobiales bacterium]|nr:ribonuclease [Verrucomicrobiales bacterium]
MMKIHGYIILTLLQIIHQVYGEEPAGYYDSAHGKNGKSLREAINQIISGHNVISYSSTDEAMSVIDADPINKNNVILIYSRKSDPTSNCCSNGWNREHLWPNSYGIDNRGPAYSDIHALRPCNSNVNSSRGNKHFDESDPESRYYKFPSHPEAILCSSDNNSWSPPESLKGDIARAMFYMDIRYEGKSGEPDLELTDDLAEITSSNSKMGSLKTLLIWHMLDPVSEEEEIRNDRVYEIQNNRNPFIDRPQWVSSIWGNPLQISISKTANSIKVAWPTTIPRTVLETSKDLTQWEVIKSPIIIQGDQNSTFANGFTNQSFRLKVK